jgi:glycosyltransferase involved in cell wall biosynthesis
VRIIEWAFPYFPSIGGRERFVERLTKDLRARALDVCLIAQMPFDQPRFVEEYPEVDLRVAPGWEIGGLDSQARSEQWQKVSGAIGDGLDLVIHIHRLEGVDLLLLKRIKEAWRIPIVMTLHGPLLAPKVHSKENEERISLVDQFIAISPHVESESLFAYPELKERITLIPNSVALRKEVEEPGEGFLFMGRLSQEKGILQLISAFFFLQQLEPEATLTVAGDGSQSTLLKNAVAKLGLSESVFFTGWLDEQILSEQISKCRAVIVPTVNQEPFGLVAIEAMAHGKPLIYSTSGALPWIVEGNRSGLPFAPGDIVALVQHMRSLHLNPEFAKELGLNGREIVASRFDPSAMVDAYIQTFERLLRQDDNE